MKWFQPFSFLTVWKFNFCHKCWFISNFKIILLHNCRFYLLLQEVNRKFSTLCDIFDLKMFCFIPWTRKFLNQKHRTSIGKFLIHSIFRLRKRISRRFCSLYQDLNRKKLFSVTKLVVKQTWLFRCAWIPIVGKIHNRLLLTNLNIQPHTSP